MRSQRSGAARPSSARSATASRARSRPLPHTTPDAAVLQETLARLQAGRRDGGGDGGVVDRARPGPGQRHPLRRGAVHQPDARPPRLPRHDGRLRRGQGEAVRLAGTRGRGGQHRRRVRRAHCGPRACTRCARALLRRERRRHHRDRHRDDGRRHGTLGGDAVGQRQLRDPRRRHVQRLEPARHARRPARERRAARRRARRDGDDCSRRPGACSASAGAARRSS